MGGGIDRLRKRLEQFDDETYDARKAETIADIKTAIAQARGENTPTLVETPAQTAAPLNKDVSEFFDTITPAARPKPLLAAAPGDIVIDVDALLWAANDDIAIALLM